MLAVLALAVAGCSEPEQPSTSLPTAVSTSAEPTLEALGPADFPVPPEAREQTEAGAMTMATYYLDLIDHTKNEVGTPALDAEPLRALSADCDVCGQIAASFENGQSLGYRYSGTELDEPDFGTLTVSGSSADVPFTVQQSALTVTGPDGAEVRSTPAVLLRGGMVFEWDSTRQAWVATQLNLVQDT
ncbi:hypothetical protein [Klenkia terrae]|uniref:Lipoprotein n=1 Tax=Klenkia terrae TaxID=1052259 RepID=A0ABU8E8V6_9ACTN|nr:hypothetical protein [Klenkia terrae]